MPLKTYKPIFDLTRIKSDDQLHREMEKIDARGFAKPFRSATTVNAVRRLPVSSRNTKTVNNFLPCRMRPG